MHQSSSALWSVKFNELTEISEWIPIKAKGKVAYCKYDRSTRNKARQNKLLYQRDGETTKAWSHAQNSSADTFTDLKKKATKAPQYVKKRLHGV